MNASKKETKLKYLSDHQYAINNQNTKQSRNRTEAKEQHRSFKPCSDRTGRDKLDLFTNMWKPYHLSSSQLQSLRAGEQQLPNVTQRDICSQFFRSEQSHSNKWQSATLCGTASTPEQTPLRHRAAESWKQRSAEQVKHRLADLAMPFYTPTK